MDGVLSLLLYGSRARGDATADSDIDLLVTTMGGPSGTKDDGRVAISWYPVDHLIRRARCGDLFAFHLVSDAKALFERQPVLARLRRAFAFRDDYRREIQMASDVGWCLLHNSSRAADAVAFNRRMAWSVHTILVGAAAEQRQPVFSADGLADFAQCREAGRVIRAKRDRVIDPGVLADFRHVLQHRGSPEPAALSDLAAERARFDADRNSAGRAALRPLLAR
jgi:predicted nucleotidyltransferase